MEIERLQESEEVAAVIEAEAMLAEDGPEDRTRGKQARR